MRSFVILSHQPLPRREKENYPVGRFQWNFALDSYILVDTPKLPSLSDLLVILLNSSHQAEVRKQYPYISSSLDYPAYMTSKALRRLHIPTATIKSRGKSRFPAANERAPEPNMIRW